MEKDWFLVWFYGLLGFFEVALGGIVLSDFLFLSYGLLEMLIFFIYFLVGFWYVQFLVVIVVWDVFLIKRVGDIIFFMGVVVFFSYGQGLIFFQLDNWVSMVLVIGIIVILLGLFLIVGFIGKCV